MVVQACRVCLSTKPPLHSFSENNLKSSFEDLIGSVIDLNDLLPHHICASCENDIIQFVQFKKWCLEVQDLLHTKVADRKQITKNVLEEIRITLPAQKFIMNQSLISGADNKTSLPYNTEYCGDNNENQYEVNLDQEDCNESVKDECEIENEHFVKSEPEVIKTQSSKIAGLAYEGLLLKLAKSDESIGDMIIKDDNIVMLVADNNKDMSQETANVDNIPGHVITNIISLADNQIASIKTDNSNLNLMNKTKSYEEIKQVIKFKRKYKLHSTTITKISKSNDLESEHLKSGKGLLLKDEQSREVKDSENIKVEKWQCGSCKYMFLSEGAMQHHLKNCNALCSPCGLCGAHFRHLKRLYEHMTKEHNDTSDTTLTCFDCNMEFKKQATLHKHWIHVHRGKVKTKPKPKVERPLSNTTHLCCECGKQFKLPCLLRQHMMKHTGERPFACDVCHKRFRLEMTLRTHKFMHSGEKPFKCTSCSRSFRQSSHLRRHIRTHTGEKPYTCALCDKQFGQTWNRAEHVRTVHEGLPPRARPGKSRKRLHTNTA